MKISELLKSKNKQADPEPDLELDPEPEYYLIPRPLTEARNSGYNENNELNIPHLHPDDPKHPVISKKLKKLKKHDSLLHHKILHWD